MTTAIGIVTRMGQDRSEAKRLGREAIEPGPAGNRPAWLSIADFLARQNLVAVLSARAAACADGGKRSAADARAAACSLTVPHGNHGENN